MIRMTEHRDCAGAVARSGSSDKSDRDASCGNVSERRRAPDAGSESEEKFRLLVDQTAEGIFLADQDGRFVDVNRGACDNLGYTREGLLGSSVPDISEGTERADIPKVKYRIFQESLSNIRRHARDATRVTVSLSHSGTEVRVVIENDGPGFDPDEAHGPDRISGLTRTLRPGGTGWGDPKCAEPPRRGNLAERQHRSTIG